jgi:hypothetical protein
MMMEISFILTMAAAVFYLVHILSEKLFSQAG